MEPLGRNDLLRNDLLRNDLLRNDLTLFRKNLRLAKEKVYYAFQKNSRKDIRECIRFLSKDFNLSSEQIFILISETVQLLNIDVDEKFFDSPTTPSENILGDSKLFCQYINLNFKNSVVFPDISWDDVSLTYHPKYEGALANVLRHTKKRFVIVPYSIQTVSSGHQKLLIIDNKKRTYEIFDPHGYGKKDKKLKLLSHIRRSMPHWYTYISEAVSCPKVSLQYLEQFSQFMRILQIKYKRSQIGFCMAWSYYYLTLKLKNPNVDSKELQLIALEKLSKGDAVRFIVNFIEFVKMLSPSAKSACEKMLRNLGLYNKNYLAMELNVKDFLKENPVYGERLRRCLKTIRIHLEKSINFLL